jgi:hypothetical protein
MSDHIIKTINDLQKRVEEHESHAVRLKTTINELCLMSNIPPKYADISSSSGPRSFQLRSDQFHGRPLATVVREYLELRRAADIGPASTAEIFEALTEGGYEFNTKSDDISKISLSNSMRKNTVFYTLPNKKWGLAEWYPNAKKKVPLSSSPNVVPEVDGDESEIGSAQVEENRQERLRQLAAEEAAEKGGE